MGLHVSAIYQAWLITDSIIIRKQTMVQGKPLADPPTVASRETRNRLPIPLSQTIFFAQFAWPR